MSSIDLPRQSAGRQWIIGWPRTHVRGAPALAIAAVTFLVALTALLITHKPTPLAVPKPIALRQVLRDPGTARMLASVHWDRVGVTPMDRRYEILEFYRGPRLVASVTAGWSGRVVILATTDGAKQSYVYGSNIANDPRVLALLSIVFVLMTAVWPLWRLRNLDVLVATSTVLAVVLFNESMLTRMVLVTYPALAYLAVRCAWWGLGRRRAPRPAMPLYERLTRRWNETERLRMLRWSAAAMALIVAMVGFTSLHVLDVGYAVMEGATLITHSVLPFGHIPDVLHGDTYPLGSYLFYVPFAWIWPVRDVWDSADVTLAVAVVAGLVAALGMRRLAGTGSGDALDDASHATKRAGLRIMIAVLSFPPLLVTVSTGTTDVVLAAMLVIALMFWRQPAGGTGALTASAWFKLTPAALLPLWLARLRGRSRVRALLAVAIVSVALTAALVALGGIGAPLRMLGAMSFQFTRSSPQTPWAILGSVPLQQLAEAATLALLAGACVRVMRDDELAMDLGRIAAVAGAVLLGIQISANYWSYMYLVWVLPFVLLSLLREPADGAAA
jgi:Glycosyltransferase family 87